MQTYPHYLRRKVVRRPMTRARAFTLYTQTLCAAWIAGELINSAFQVGAIFAQNIVIIATGYGQ